MSIDNEILLLVSEGQWDVPSVCFKCQKWLKIKNAIYFSLGIQNANTQANTQEKADYFDLNPLRPFETLSPLSVRKEQFDWQVLPFEKRPLFE